MLTPNDALAMSTGAYSFPTHKTDLSMSRTLMMNRVQSNYLVHRIIRTYLIFTGYFDLDYFIKSGTSKYCSANN